MSRFLVMPDREMMVVPAIKNWAENDFVTFYDRGSQRIAQVQTKNVTWLGYDVVGNEHIIAIYRFKVLGGYLRQHGTIYEYLETNGRDFIPTPKFFIVSKYCSLWRGTTDSLEVAELLLNAARVESFFMKAEQAL